MVSSIALRIYIKECLCLMSFPISNKPFVLVLCTCSYDTLTHKLADICHRIGI